MAEKSKAEKKITLANVESGLTKNDFDNIEQVKQAIADGLVKAELDVVEVENGKFSGDYVKLTPGPKALEAPLPDFDTLHPLIKALVIISGGNLVAPMKETKEGEPEARNERKPNLVKYAIYGSDLAARSTTSQRIKTAAQGPEKSIERMAEMLSKTKGIPLDEAREQVKALME
jgi:hypothetical protein